jgi:hypothetical protein
MDAEMLAKLFSFTHFRKNTSATPLVSHTFKTKDLKGDYSLDTEIGF